MTYQHLGSSLFFTKSHATVVNLNLQVTSEEILVRVRTSPKAVTLWNLHVEATTGPQCSARGGL